VREQLIDSTSTEWWRPDFADQTTVEEVPGERDSAVPFWALIGFTFILLISPQTYLPPLRSIRPALLMAAVAITAYLFDQLIHRRPILRLTREMRIIAWLVGWAIITIPFSYWVAGSVSVLTDSYLKTLTVFWLICATVNRLTRLRQITWGLTLMGVPIAVTAVQNYLLGSLIPEAQRISGYEAGLAANPNDLALMVNLIFPLTMALLIGSRKPVTRFILLIILFLDILAVIVTFSRGGFLTLATLFVMYLWKFRNRFERKWITAVFLTALLCIPFLPSAYWDRLSTMTNIGSDLTGSAQERWTSMVAAVIFVVKHPIVGAGLGMDTLAMNQERGAIWREIHNVYLQYAVDLGIPGLILFLLLLVACIRSATQVQRQSARIPALRELFFFAEGVQISLLVFSLAAMFHPVAYQLYFYYMAGLAVAVRTVYEVERTHAVCLDQAVGRDERVA